MEMLRKSIIVLILLGVVALAWVGGSIYYQNSSIDVDPNAQGLTKTLRPDFDVEELEKKPLGLLQEIGDLVIDIGKGFGN